MALLFFDSFDHYVGADINLKYPSYTGIAITSGGRNGTNRIYGANANFTKTFPATDEMICGFAWNATSPGSRILAFASGVTAQLTMSYTTGPKLRVTVAGGSYDGSFIFSPSVWYYFEVRLKIHDTAGEIEVRIDGSPTPDIYQTNIDTQTSTLTTMDSATLGLTGNGTWSVDDLYLCDTTGPAPNNTFLGDVRVVALLPSGSGNYTQWTPSTGSNYQNVDEAAPDGDSTYNSTATPSNKDTFAFGDLSMTGTVHGVQYILHARKDDAGTRVIAPMARISSTDYVSGTSHYLGSSYAYYIQCLEQSPASSSAWTVSEINGAEFGYELES
jgi:hypothetical protein